MGLLVVSSVDNVLKPMIISRGSDLPFILVLLGVFGGVVAFGFIGVFLGPVLLALGFALVKEWAPPARTPTTRAPNLNAPRRQRRKCGSAVMRSDPASRSASRTRRRSGRCLPATHAAVHHRAPHREVDRVAVVGVAAGC